MSKLSELQQIELEILKDFDAFCQRHDLKYFLGEGTLLGTIRHHGFIPWDDDIDVIMKRDEYERFLALARQEYNDKYEVQHSTTIKGYWSPVLKIRLLKYANKKLSQTHISHLTKNNGPVIDVFPLDYVPKKSSIKMFIQCYRIQFLRKTLTLKYKILKPQNLTEKIINLFTGFYSVEKIHEKFESTFKWYGTKPRDYIAAFSTYHSFKHLVVPATVFDNTLYWDFEDAKFPVPAGYDLLLTTIYGDYMTPPKESDRIGRHYFEG